MDDYLERVRQAERMARNKLCYEKCFCPKFKAKSECDNCPVFVSLRDYYLTYVIGTEPLDSISRWSWEDIAKISESGKAEELFSLGDEKRITLNNGEVATVVIIGFNHDNLADGNKAGITFALKEVLRDEFRMNGENTNKGGWRTSEMRTIYLQQVLRLLPIELQKHIKPVVKTTGVGGVGWLGNVEQTIDKLFLFSGNEVDGKQEYVDSGLGGAFYGPEDWAAPNEGKQYSYFVDSKNHVVSKNGKRVDWWLRSPHIGDGAYFCCVDREGEMQCIGANCCECVRFGFCV